MKQTLLDVFMKRQNAKWLLNYRVITFENYLFLMKEADELEARLLNSATEKDITPLLSICARWFQSLRH